jgi:hypothetical protein
MFRFRMLENSRDDIRLRTLLTALRISKSIPSPYHHAMALAPLQALFYYRPMADALLIGKSSFRERVETVI